MATITEKLSDAFADQASGPAADGTRPYVIYYDPEIKGFGLRVTKAAAKSWILNYRAKGIERRLTIGTFRDPWRAAAARKEAGRLKALIDQGHDPMGDRHHERSAPTVNDLIARWREEHAPKNRARTTRENERLIAQWIKPELGTKKVADVGFDAIDGLHRKISRRGNLYRANRTAALLSKLFSLAVKWRMTELHPVKGLERNPEEPRSTYLSPEQLERLLGAIADHPHQTAANAIRLLLLTGARSGETFKATWSQFDLAAGVWTKPSSYTKQRSMHRVPLSPQARELLAKIKSTASSIFVFPDAKGTGPLMGVRHDWAKICAAAGLEGVRIHDLRHSFASFLASSGLSLPIIGSLLGHTQSQTTQRYAHLLDAPLREATGRVGAIVAQGDKIVALRRGKAS